MRLRRAGAHRRRHAAARGGAREARPGARADPARRGHRRASRARSREALDRFAAADRAVADRHADGREGPSLPRRRARRRRRRRHRARAARLPRRGAHLPARDAARRPQRPRRAREGDRADVPAGCDAAPVRGAPRRRRLPRRRSSSGAASSATRRSGTSISIVVSGADAGRAERLLARAERRAARRRRCSGRRRCCACAAATARSSSPRPTARARSRRAAAQLLAAAAPAMRARGRHRGRRRRSAEPLDVHSTRHARQTKSWRRRRGYVERDEVDERAARRAGRRRAVARARADPPVPRCRPAHAGARGRALRRRSRAARRRGWRTLMHDARGVGLAATQVGVLQRLFVFQRGEDDEVTRSSTRSIVERSDELEVDDEGCLSLQGVLVPVERAVRGHARGAGRPTASRFGSSSRSMRRARRPARARPPRRRADPRPHDRRGAPRGARDAAAAARPSPRV